jgi:hypothetical protein
MLVPIVTMQSLFAVQTFLAVVGEETANDDFWLAQAAQNVYADTDAFNVNWLEVTEDEQGEKRLSYNKSKEKNSVELDYVITDVDVKEAKSGVFTITAAQKKAILKSMADVVAGNDPKFREDAADEDLNGDVTEEEEEVEVSRPPKKKGRRVEVTPADNKPTKRRGRRSRSVEASDTEKPRPRKRTRGRSAKAEEEEEESEEENPSPPKKLVKTKGKAKAGPSGEQRRRNVSLQ